MARYPRLTDAQIARARSLLEDGASYAETARTTGHDADTLSRRLPGYGWTQREGGLFSSQIRRFADTL